jgi:hypothetical protein
MCKSGEWSMNMLPDVRFLLAGVIALLVLLASAFGLAANFRVAHTTGLTRPPLGGPMVGQDRTDFREWQQLSLAAARRTEEPVVNLQPGTVASSGETGGADRSEPTSLSVPVVAADSDRDLPAATQFAAAEQPSAASEMQDAPHPASAGDAPTPAPAPSAGNSAGTDQPETLEALIHKLQAEDTMPGAGGTLAAPGDVAEDTTSPAANRADRKPADANTARA